MKFGIGDRVRTRANASPHTRMPEYLAGRRGEIERVLGIFPFADERANGNRDAKQALYTVRFRGDDVWEEDSARTTSISADLFESYMEADV